MKLEYGTKSLEYDGSGTASATKVTLVNSNGDIIAMPYPFENNAKWPSGTKTIFKFQMQANEGYTYKDQALAEMLQQGVLTVVMPRIE